MLIRTRLWRSATTRRVPVTARELPREERDRIYPLIVERAPGFGDYETRTDRVIPVFELVPAELMRRRLAPLLATGLVTVACGGADQQSASSLSTPRPDAQTGGDEQGGTMTVTYEDATTPEAIADRDLLKNNQVLEDMADDVNQTLALPYDIPLLGAHCDEANAWDPTANTVTICYEDTANSERSSPKQRSRPRRERDQRRMGDVLPRGRAHGGHRLRSAVTGREEDVADQLAAYILLTPGDAGPPPGVGASVKDFARVFGASENAVTDDDMADVHSLDQQRVYNLQCSIYGSNPGANGDLVTDGQLPEGRADGCADEWQQLDKAWSTLLEPHFR